jgi:hypothetical protein
MRVKNSEPQKNERLSLLTEHEWRTMRSLTIGGHKLNGRRLAGTFLLGTIDYRCQDGRSPVSVGCVTIRNPDSLSSSETGVNPGEKSEKKKNIYVMSSKSESQWW